MLQPPSPQRRGERHSKRDAPGERATTYEEASDESHWEGSLRLSC